MASKSIKIPFNIDQFDDKIMKSIFENFSCSELVTVSFVSAVALTNSYIYL